MNMIEFYQAAYHSAGLYYDFLKNSSRGGNTIHVRALENIGKLRFKLFISQKLFSPDSVELKISPSRCPMDLEPEEANIIEYNEKELYIVVVTSPRVYDTLQTCNAEDVSLFSDLTFLVKAVQNFYRGCLYADNPPISYPPTPEPPDEIEPPEYASEEQYKAICSVFSNPISYVWGAPGTGKTQLVLANCLIQYINDDKSVLLLAPTNNSLEQSLRGVLKVMDENDIPRKKIIRLGKATSEFLSVYPEICESSQYDNLVGAMARELEQLRAEQEQQLHCQFILDNHQKLQPLLSEHRALSESLENANSTVADLKRRLSESHTKISEYRETKDALSIQSHSLKTQAETQARYFLFVKHYTDYRMLVDQYHANIEKLTADLHKLEETYSAENMAIAHVRSDLDSKNNALELYIQGNNTIQERTKRLLSQQKKMEYEQAVAAHRQGIELVQSELKAKNGLLEQLAERIADIKGRIQQENSVKIGHPILFEVSTALYGKVYPFDELTSMLTAEVEKFSNFCPDDGLDEKISSTAQLYDSTVSLFESERATAKELKVEIEASELTASEIRKRIENTEGQVTDISLAVFGEPFSITDLVLKLNERVDTYADFQFNAGLADLILQKEEEYQSCVVQLRDILSQKQIIACTLDYATIHFKTLRAGLAQSISHLFVDEAAYCSLVKAGIIFAFGVPVSLFGDHMQLPPICEMKKKMITNTPENNPIFMFDMSAIHFPDLFSNDMDLEALYQRYVDNRPPLFTLIHVTFLTKTFRFGQKLASILDRHIYHRGFHGVESAQTEIVVIDAPKGTNNSSKNNSPSEAEAIKKYINKTSPEDYIILSPYRDQCRTIEKHLHLRTDSVLTVHKSQGREWDTVILSVTDTLHPYFMSSLNHESNGLQVINTAVSRARHRLVLVLDYECWKRKKGEMISDLANSYFGVQPGAQVEQVVYPGCSNIPYITTTVQGEAALQKIYEEKKSELERLYEQKKTELQRQYEQKERDFDLWRKQKEQQLNAEHDALRLEMARISGETAEVEQSFLQLEHIENQISSSLVPLFGQKVITSLINSTTTKSFLRGLEGDFKLTSPITFDEVTIESDGVPYDVSLISCNCPSKQRPCKHMIWLALNLGALHFNPNDQEKILDRIAESATAYQSVIEQTKKDQDSLKKDKKKLKDERKIIESEKYTHPELGQLLAEYEKCIDENRERMLPCNALKSAEIVSAIKKEKQKLIKEKNLYFSKVTVYESLFPWLVEFKDMTMDDVRRLGEETSKHEDYVTFLRFWLTPEEFTVLSPSEKIQLALKRSKK